MKECTLFSGTANSEIKHLASAAKIQQGEPEVYPRD